MAMTGARTLSVDVIMERLGIYDLAATKEAGSALHMR